MEQKQKPEEVSPRFHSNQGFSVVVALAMGLLMTLLALTILFRTQNDKLLANKEGTASKSLEAADAGAAYYQALLFRYPILATFNSCDINDFDGECNNPDLTTSWKNITRIAESSNACTSSTTLSADDRTQIQNALNWRNLPSTPPNNDQNKKYRVVSYQYDQPNSTGTLIIESQVSPLAASNTSVTGGTSSARVAVRFRVKSIFDPGAKINPFVRLPGIWAKSFLKTGTPSLRTDICDSSNNNGSSALVPLNSLDENYIGSLSSPEASKITKVDANEDFPTLPTEGSTATSLTGALAAPNPLTVEASQSCQIPLQAGVSCPTSPYNDPSQPDVTSSPPTKIYRYVIPSIEVKADTPPGSQKGRLTLGTPNNTLIIRVNSNIKLNSGTTLEIANGARVIIYLGGNFIGGGALILHEGKPEDFQIYKYGSGNLSLRNNTNPISAFIFAPEATTLLYAGTRVEGAVWTNKLDLRNAAGITQGIIAGFSGKSNVPAAVNSNPPNGRLKIFDDPTNPSNPNNINLGNYITVPEVWERCPLDVDYSNTTNPSLCIPKTN
jgi:hypothetical protein